MAVSQLARVGSRDGFGREVFVLSVSGVVSVPLLKLPSPRFACLVACDASALSGPDLLTFGKQLLGQGAVYVCAWGPGCEDFEDAVDEAAVDADLSRETEQPVIMTTSHADETLGEALEFLFRSACPDEAYADSCRSAVAIAVGNRSWAEEMQEWLRANG